MSKLHHVVLGDGEQPVVFIHGLFGQGKNFTTIAKGLADVATSYLVDLPNHGQSPWTDEFDMADQAELVADQLASLPHPAALIAHSLGGKLAMLVALQRPELIERLMVVDMVPTETRATRDVAPLAAAMQGLDVRSLTSRRDADQQLADQIPDAGTRGFLLQSLVRDETNGWRWAFNLDLLSESLPAISGWPAAQGTYTGPTLFVGGETSPYRVREHRDEIKRYFPGATVTTIKGASHWVHADTPEVFTATARAFISDNSSQVKSALEAGEASGEPQPFDFDEFISARTKSG